MKLRFIIIREIPSQPCALLGFSDRMIVSNSSSEMLKSAIKV